MDETGHHPACREVRQPFDHLVQQLHGGVVPLGGIRGRRRPGELREAVIHKFAHMLGFIQCQQALEGADADMAMAQPGKDGGTGGRRLVPAHQFLTGLDDGEGLRGIDPECLEHLCRQQFAHRALERKPSVGSAAVWRLPRSLGAQIHQASVGSAQLRVQEAAPVADFGIVHAELVAMVSQCQRALQITAQRFEPAEMGDPVVIRKMIQPHAGRRPIIAPAQLRLRKCRRGDRVAQPIGEGQNGRRSILCVWLRFIGHRGNKWRRAPPCATELPPPNSKREPWISALPMASGIAPTA